MNNSTGDSKTFQGTAEYYAKYRPKIPTEVTSYLKEKYHLDGSGILLDIGCGTGISTIAFAPLFSKVIAFDPNQEMLEEAIRHNSRLNIDWRLCSDENLDLRGEKINFAIAVRSFHWVHQDSFLSYLQKHMAEGGVISIIGDGSFWTGSELWQQKIKEVIQSFLGPERRAGKRKPYTAPQEPYDVVLKRNGFTEVDSYSIPVTRHWSLESIIGYLYSTSFSSYTLYNGQNEAFEDKLKKELLEINQGDQDFIEHAVFFVQSGKLLNKYPLAGGQ